MSPIYIGQQKHCLKCDTPLTTHDSLPVYLKGCSIKLPDFCLTCQYTLPYIHKVYCNRCGAYEACFNNCHLYTELDQNFSSLAYSEEVKEWMRAYKFEGNLNIGKALKPLLLLPVNRFLEATGQSKRFKQFSLRGLFSYSDNANSCNIVTSVPISKQRLLERGFNQASIFAEEVAASIRAPFLPLLMRQNGYEHISHMKRHEREQVVRDLYYCCPAKIKQLQYVLATKQARKVNIIIVDDIYTTGHTLRACARELKRCIKLPCSIFSITLARA